MKGRWFGDGASATQLDITNESIQFFRHIDLIHLNMGWNDGIRIGESLGISKYLKTSDGNLQRIQWLLQLPSSTNSSFSYYYDYDYDYDYYYYYSAGGGDGGGTGTKDVGDVVSFIFFLLTMFHNAPIVVGYILALLYSIVFNNI